MKNARSILALGLVAMSSMSGCASSRSDGNYPSAFTRQAECERDGGWWHADSNFCEYQTPSGPGGPRSR